MATVWRTDGHGLAFKAPNAKIYGPTHTWAMKLSMLHHTAGGAKVITYSLPKPDTVVAILGRRPERVQIICHEKFEDRARYIKAELPTLDVAIAPDVHTKIVLIEPRTIYVTSANFGHSGWHETTLGVRSEEAYQWYMDNCFLPLWQKATVIQ